jgi:hypothetical protein
LQGFEQGGLSGERENANGNAYENKELMQQKDSKQDRRGIALLRRPEHRVDSREKERYQEKESLQAQG